MTPALRAAIDAATDLAWRPTCNLPASVAYGDRKESHERLIVRLETVGALPPDASDELRYLVAAMVRVAAATVSNRVGLPYYERRQAVWELRGCLDVWQRSVGVS